MITYHQMNLADIFTETQKIFESDKPEFLKLLESTIALCEIIPVSFRNHFYASTGRFREYQLTSYSGSSLFSGFSDASKITRFKQEFTDDLQLFFDSLVDLTEPFLQEIDAEKTSMSMPLGRWMEMMRFRASYS